tara:strand:- start:43 stop:405 length:363 start_codon:yes stop_codon:yes gene_type:complete
MNRKTFKVSYDKESDIIAFYNMGNNVSESIEISEGVILDIDKEGKILALELFDALDFFSSMNSEITKEFLSNIKSAELRINKFKENSFISIHFENNEQKIKETLPFNVSSQISGATPVFS